MKHRAGAVVALVPTRDYDRSWVDLVSTMLTWDSATGEVDASGSYFDVIDGCLTSCNGRQQLKVDVAILGDMVAVGALIPSTGEFGDKSYTVNMRMLKFNCTSAFERGSADPVHHVAARGPPTCCKLTLMLYLVAIGWKHEDRTDDFFALGSAKAFDLSHARPRSYFVCLATAQEVLAKLQVFEESVPVIHHEMPDSYYKAPLAKIRATSI